MCDFSSNTCSRWTRRLRHAVFTAMVVATGLASMHASAMPQIQGGAERTAAPHAPAGFGRAQKREQGGQ